MEDTTQNLRRSAPSDDEGQSNNHLLPNKKRKGSSGKACDSCTSMFSQQGIKHLNSRNGFRHQTRTECDASKSEGCMMCKIILQAIYKQEIIWEENDCLVFWNFRDAHSATTVANVPLSGIYGLRGSFESDPKVLVVKLYTYAERVDPMAAIVRRRPLRRNVQGKEMFEAAKSLLGQCMSSKDPHKHCMYSRDTVLPNRVLDVGTLDHPHIKLLINETEVHEQYLALSYCWGKSPKKYKPMKHIQLGKDNLQRLVDGIKLERLPQSIQDAIVVTRKLEFSYLWVDSLCIIQDCEKDKAEQISRMALIYKNATITIAASSSESAHVGFLEKDIPPYLPDVRLEVSMADKSIGMVYISAEAHIPSHPLDKRGWALQEFMLSSRMLIFSDYELLWQCKEIELRGVTGMGLEYLQPLESLPWTVFDDDAEPHYGNVDTDRIYLWKTIIQQYTERQLSCSDDRMHAITGITTELETLWDDIHVYGLWKKWFIQLLAWHKPRGMREEVRHLERAPSWSWLSFNGVVHYETSLSIEDARVKVLTTSTVVLQCRLLKEADISKKKRDTIREQPDLLNPFSELQRGALQEKTFDYLLLGNIQGSKRAKKGVGLLLLEVNKGVYRRVGFAVFGDMAIWKDKHPQDVTLETKQ